jgi:hypothetical protein
LSRVNDVPASSRRRPVALPFARHGQAAIPADPELHGGKAAMARETLKVTVFTAADSVTITLDSEAAWQTIESARDERAPVRSAPDSLDLQLLTTELPSVLVGLAQRHGVLSILGDDGTSWAIPADAVLGIRVEGPASATVTPRIGLRIAD